MILVEMIYFILMDYIILVLQFIFFFFQAEDGIRDLTVTGVQTCALPIYEHAHDARSGRNTSAHCRADSRTSPGDRGWTYGLFIGADSRLHRRRCDRRWRGRSEERRVGKECRSRWSTDPEKKKTKVRSGES